MSISARTTLRVSLCTLVLAAFAACAGGPAVTVAPTPTGPTAPPVINELGPGCELLTDAQLTNLASFTVESKRERGSNETVAACEWRGSHATSGAGTITVRAWPKNGPATLDTESGRLANTFGTFAPYTGMGDRGAVAHGGGLYVVKGDRLVFVEARFGGEAATAIQEALLAVLLDTLP